MVTIDKSIQNQRVVLEKALTDAKGSRNIASIKKALDDIIVFHQRQNAFDQSIIYCNELLPFLHDTGMENELANKQVYMGTCYLKLSDYGKAEESYYAALGLFQKVGNYFGCAEANVNLGRISQAQGQLESSMAFLNAALEIYEQHNQELDSNENQRPRYCYSGALEVTGIIYSQLKQFDQAIEYLQRNLKIQKRHGYSVGIMQCLINIGATYSESDTAKALEYYLEARSLISADTPLSLTAAVTNNIGGCYEDQGDYPAALQYYYDALQIVEANQQLKHRPAILKHIGTVYLKHGMYDMALEKTLLSLQLSTEEDARVDIQDCYKLLSDIYAAQGDLQAALDYLKRYSALKDVVFNDELVQKLASLQSKYDATSIRLVEVQKQNSLVTEALKKAINMSFVGVSSSIRRVHELAMEAAVHQDTNVLVTGESGVGKEIIARLIHFASARKAGMFVDVNCSSIPESLAESEFFGYNKGAFTGAMYPKAGFLEEADRGTLFLDEIGDMPWVLQPKLLRALETRQIKRIGSNKPIGVNFRLVSATNKNIAELILDNRFRADLMYRINTIEIQIPPLRERKDDIEPLLEYYLSEYAKRMNKTVPLYDSACINWLCDYAFPGNVRELRNMIERVMIFIKGNTLRVEDFASQMPCEERDQKAAEVTTSSKLQDVEDTMLLKELIACKGNQAQAAKNLGISYSTFKRRHKKLKDK